MELKIEKADLISLLAKTQNIVEKRNTMPVLVNVLLDADDSKLKIFATDLEVSLTDISPCEILKAGKVAVGAKSLYDIVKELPEGSIHLTKKDNNWLEIQQNKSVYNIVGISAEEYPVFPTFSTNEFTNIDSETLKDMIEKTIYSVSTDETRYHLNGVYLETDKSSKKAYRMVSTDGHRLSVVNREIAGAVDSAVLNGVIIPRKGLNEIRKILDTIGSIQMAIEGSQLIVKQNETILMIRLIEGKYPNYQQLIPDGLQKTVNVSTEQLLSSLKRVSLLSNQKSKGITLKLGKNTMEITSNNPELGDAKEEIEVNYGGEDLKIGFNAKYLIDVLGNVNDDSIDIEFKDQLSPALLRPHNDPGYQCVVMPMRL